MFHFQTTCQVVVTSTAVTFTRTNQHVHKQAIRINGIFYYNLSLNITYKLYSAGCWFFSQYIFLVSTVQQEVTLVY